MKQVRFLALLLAAMLLATCAFAEAPADPIVIKAGDYTKTLSEVQEYFDSLYAQYNEYYLSYGMALSDTEIGYIRDEAVEMMAMFAVMDNKVAALGLGEVTDADKETLLAEAQASYDEYITSYSEYYGLSAEEAAEDMAGLGLSVEVLYDDMLTNLPYNRLIDTLLADINITDEDVDAEYAAYVESDKTTYGDDAATYELYTQYYGSQILYVPTGFRMVKHILLDMPEQIGADLIDFETDMAAKQTEIDTLNDEMYALENVDENAETKPRTAEEIQADLDAKQVEYDALSAEYQAIREKILPEMKAQLDEIYAKLDAGETFDSLVVAYGTDPGMEAYPGGYQVHKDSVIYDTIFRDAAMALAKIGDVSEPVLTDFGVHIIQYAADVSAGAAPITEELRTTIYETLLSEAQNNIVGEKVEEWMAEYTIEKYPELLVLPTAAAEATTTP